jgi:hypothetical protein
MTNIRCERLILDGPDLPQDWYLAYGLTKDRRSRFLNEPTHSDSFFKRTSETAMTVFTLGRLEGWMQAQLVTSGVSEQIPRTSDGWNNSFFKRLTSPWNSATHRSSALSELLSMKLGLPSESTKDLFLMFEVKTFNNALNGGKTIRNPSFLEVPGEWSKFDALVVLPFAKTLVFFECKVNADGTHGASGYDLPQPFAI